VIPRSTTIGPEGRRLRKTLIVLGIIVVVGNLATTVIGRLVRGETVSGPPGSSYVSTALGSAALAELLESEGAVVNRLRHPYTRARLDPSETLALVEVGFSSFTDSEIATVGVFVEQGGRLVLAGSDPARLLATIGVDPEEPPRWAAGGPPTATAATIHVDEVPLGGRGQFTSWGRATPILEGEEGEVVAIEWGLEDGEVVWLADPTPLLNHGLADGDSAGFAMTLMAGRDVVFDEYRHGFGGESFWQLLPDRWAGTLVLLSIAALTGMVAYARRLGPPEDTERRLQPDRAAYVESVAAILGRTGPVREAIGPVRARVRRLLITRAGLGLDATDQELKAAAHDAGLDPDDMEAVLDPLGDPVPAGRALAQLSTRR